MAKQKLTKQQELESLDFIINDLEDSADWVTRLWKSKHFRKLKQELQALEKFQRDVEKGKVSKKSKNNEVNPELITDPSFDGGGSAYNLRAGSVTNGLFSSGNALPYSYIITQDGIGITLGKVYRVIVDVESIIGECYFVLGSNQSGEQSEHIITPGIKTFTLPYTLPAEPNNFNCIAWDLGCTLQLNSVSVVELGESSVATMNDVEYRTRLDRDYTPEIIADILLGIRHPYDLHLYSDDIGVAE